MVCTIEYGALYNWYAATDVRNIAADGWHVPTNTEWTTLITFLGGGTDAAAALKEVGDTYWNTGNDGTNTSGFNARGSALRDTDGTFYDLKSYIELWSADEGYDFGIQWDTSPTWNLSGNDSKLGFALRLIKDSTTLSHGETGTYTGNDGKIYNTICIGTQECLSANLAETKYRDGTNIPNVTDNTEWAALTTGAMCYYDNDIDNSIICIYEGICLNAKYIKFCTETTPGPIVPDLKAYWALNELVGSTAYDSVGLYNGSIVGTPTLGSPGIINYAIDFDGSGDYLNCGSTVGDIGTGDITIIGWVSLLSSVNTYNGIFGNQGSYPSYQMHFGNGLDDFFIARLNINYSTTLEITSNGGAVVGTFYFVTLVLDRDGLMKMYINAIEQMDTVDISAYSGLDITNTNTFNVGNIGSALWGYYGHIRADSFGIFTKVLSLSEIQYLYNSGLGREYPF